MIPIHMEDQACGPLRIGGKQEFRGHLDGVGRCGHVRRQPRPLMLISDDHLHGTIRDQVPRSPDRREPVKAPAGLRQFRRRRLKETLSMDQLTVESAKRLILQILHIGANNLFRQPEADTLSMNCDRRPCFASRGVQDSAHKGIRHENHAYTSLHVSSLTIPVTSYSVTRRSLCFTKTNYLFSEIVAMFNIVTF